MLVLNKKDSKRDSFNFWKKKLFHLNKFNERRNKGSIITIQELIKWKWTLYAPKNQDILNTLTACDLPVYYGVKVCLSNCKIIQIIRWINSLLLYWYIPGLEVLFTAIEVKGLVCSDAIQVHRDCLH